MAIKAVTAFRTDDGKTFSNLQEARQHEALLKLEALVEQQEAWSWRDEEVLAFLLVNKKEIATLLGAIP